MDKYIYIHYCQILLDKLEAIGRIGLSASKIHDIEIDILIMRNWIDNLNSKWWDEKVKDINWANEHIGMVERVINRVKKDLITFVYPNRKE